MSHIKIMQKYFLFFIILLFLKGCCCGPNPSIYDSLYIDNFFTDDNDTIYINYKKYSEYDKNIVASQDHTTHQWKIIDDNTSFLNDDKITYKDNKVIVNDKALEYDLPTILDIQNATGINFSNAIIKYTPFRVEKNFTWDKKSHIVSIGVNREEKYEGSYIFSSIYYIYIKKTENSWTIKLIDKLETPTYDGDEFDQNDFIDIDKNVYRLSLDKKAAFCLKSFIDKYGDHVKGINTLTKCYTQEENKVVIKNLFTDIYPKEYLDTIIKYQQSYKAPNEIDYFFDKDNNMHLFYNDTDTTKGKYFNYVMFTTKSPTTPLYEQKIPWEGE